ncbi:tripartite tricarboxylate transporter substrate binding protein [Halobellus sp. Atlit-38R]|uniref:Bug family tripartite tricarboxylate transporter substrate binding protein n=1 Tax=Halobellus sp. Atlit-38R TaxID=2282131 RepID=UPI000EF2827D|nr:tripartite tricarboxylate transporter substrate binding protein [Halobellus sp. Atlit-38R]RLM83642.1 tripartite tricarboxylate transporter substrate binding protein [Halobellus sp. Atlit-38R]
MDRRTYLQGITSAAAVGVAGCTEIRGSQGYPNESITIIVPWAQGGGTDRSTRILVSPWQEELNAEFVVENYPGGSTQVGGERLYNAEPDGHTVSMWNLPQMNATRLFQNAPYTIEDFDYIGTNHFDPTMWFAGTQTPYENMTDLIDDARERPGEITVGLTSAVGNTALSALLVQDTYDVEFNLVNLEGGSSVRQNVLGGQVPVVVNQPWAFNPANVGEVTPLGSHTAERQSLWPETPSFAELGLDDIPLVDEGLGQWKLMMAPGGLKEEYPDRYQTLVDSYKRAMETEEYRESAAKQGNLNKILRYNEPDNTFEIVQSVSDSMREFEGLFDTFRNR